MRLSCFLRVLSALSIFLFILNTSITSQQSSEPILKIHYLGHSAFVLQFDNGVTVVTDYGHENAWVQWGWDSPINNIGNLIPDVMTFSHQHDDHYDPDRIPEGVSHILTGLDSLSINGIEIKPVRTCEDSINVESNTSYIFTYKGLSICHLADAQAEIMNINDEGVRKHVTAIFPGTFDLLFMTIEGKQKFIPLAEAFIDFLKPQQVIPMHYWSEEYKNEFLDYLRTQNNTGKKYQIKENDSSVYEFSVSEDTDSVRVITLTRAPFESTSHLLR